jgi:hypothetical protein
MGALARCPPTPITPRRKIPNLLSASLGVESVTCGARARKGAVHQQLQWQYHEAS